MRLTEIEVDGRTYIWNGDTWTDEEYLRPPAHVRGQLTGRLVRRLNRARLKTLDIDLTLRVASACLEAGELEDAEKMARKVLRADPKHVGAAICLATVLRKLRRPRQVLKVTEPFIRRHDGRLHTIRAAAFADISDWDHAEKHVRRALVLDKTEASAETLQVMARVVSARAREAA